jgi:hypothetical protein
MKTFVYRVLLIAASVLVICTTYIATTRASCVAGCRNVAGGFPLLQYPNCFGVNVPVCPYPFAWCQNTKCVYVAENPPPPHNVYGWATACVTDALLCQPAGQDNCTHKNGPP